MRHRKAGRDPESILALEDLQNAAQQALFD
jgi:hypothetical protein